MFLHGAGTVSGFNFSASWARKFKVYLPYHPGFGESADSAAITSIDDYVLHYLELLDHLELDKVRLVGLSLGGWIAATLATQNSHRLKKLVLVGPAGLRVPEHPTTDIFRLKPDELPSYLVQDLSVLAPYVPDPQGPDFLDFLVNDYHEMSSFARLAWERPYDPNLAKWLHRIDVPDAAALRRQRSDHAGAAVEDVGGVDSERRRCRSSRTRVTLCSMKKRRPPRRFWTFYPDSGSILPKRGRTPFSKRPREKGVRPLSRWEGYMANPVIKGIHHITLCASGAQEDVDFCTQVLGQRLIKQTVLFDGRYAHYHLYYANANAEVGSVLTTFPYKRVPGPPGFRTDFLHGVHGAKRGDQVLEGSSRPAQDRT